MLGILLKHTVISYAFDVMCNGFSKLLNVSPELEEISLEENVFYQKVTYIDINNSIVHRYNVTFRIIYGELLIIMIYDGLTVTYVYKDDILNVKK